MHPAWNAHAPYCHLWPDPIYNIFPHYLINGTIFQKRCRTQIMCFYFPYSFCLKHFSFWEDLSEMYSKPSSGLHSKYSSFLSDFKTWILSLESFSKNTQRSNFMKIRPVGAEMFRAERREDGRTDITKLIVAFRNFWNAPKTKCFIGLHFSGVLLRTDQNLIYVAAMCCPQ